MERLERDNTKQAQKLLKLEDHFSVKVNLKLQNLPVSVD